MDKNKQDQDKQDQNKQDQNKQDFIDSMQALSSNDKKEVVARAMNNLTASELKEAIEKVCAIGLPTDPTRDRLWLIGVWSFAIVMVGTCFVLALGLFISQPSTPITNGDILFSIFTAAVGFFAGLFAPSPRT